MEQREQDETVLTIIFCLVVIVIAALIVLKMS